MHVCYTAILTNNVDLSFFNARQKVCTAINTHVLLAHPKIGAGALGDTT